ncbi:GNAT family N-acetyltransferase [Actinomadura fulvescens]|uniref:GNAT family N-acetyltransferase n=1 Tax=Actinomadura fulvescens TaxID=46160 RepID=UPI0031D1FA8C
MTGPIALSAFIEVPYRLYRDDACWVPPRRGDCRRLLDRRRNRFFEYGDVGLFVARRGRTVLGRIAAIHNRRHPCEGFFGQFECVDDLAAARALFRAAGEWLGERGLSSMLGPVNLTTNDECGTLMEGFHLPPALLTAYNPPYHQALLRGCGLTKAKDLYSWEWMAEGSRFPASVGRIAARAERGGVTVRHVDLSDFRAELERVRTLVNLSLGANWGFQPFSDREFDELALRLRPWLRPEFLLIAEVGGRPAGTALGVPDVNRALAAARGALPGTGLLRILRAARRIDHGRFLLMGVLPEHRLRGVEALLLARLEAAARQAGLRSVEISWTLEDNHHLNRAFERFGCRRTKVHRLWHRDLC